ncbi:spore photoproduct lyase family protein [uncultured Tenacibaculum sp.]|uniref:SPL family radical SAM protein n=1 Tax=uncultured Tenacibaculum sp. TaxID=174713 RepID=UPI002610CE1A|nr:radical SAM protein [uncultured Tenacibaculum sp.]
MPFKIKEIAAKSIIGTTQVPSADYVINPYTGCQFACMYCFASFMGRFVGETTNNWGKYVYVKTNAIELMEKDIQRLMKKNPHPKIAMSTVTDPYQGVEKQYRLTRGILEVFVKYQYQGRVGLLTKSPMILDDLELLKKIPNLEVGMSITTTDDQLSRFLEVKAPLASARLRTLKKLNKAGIKTYVFIGPFLPHMKLKPELIDNLFSEIKAAGTNDVKIEYLNLPKYVRPKMNKLLKEESKEIQEVYTTSQLKKYREQIAPILRNNLLKHGLKLKFDEIIHHITAKNLVE